MQENKKNRYMTVFLLLGICTAVFVILNICIGSVRITLPDMIKIFAGSGDDETLKKILVDIRFPRAVAVLILGEHCHLRDIFCRHFSTILLLVRLSWGFLLVQKW